VPAESLPAGDTEYGRVLQKLLVINRDRKVKFGVENTLALIERLPAYAPAFPAVHVAGTNGAPMRSRCTLTP
jgi:folylpolyglutamate synthase/dihydropteroate synthase